MQPRASTDPVACERIAGTAVSILLVDDDPEYLARLERALGDDERLAVRAETAPAAALAGIDAVDCVVSAHAMEPTTGLELLEAVRAREPNLPFVLHANAPIEAVSDGLFAHDHTDYVQKGGAGTIELLRSRLLQLVEYRRAIARLQRALASLDAVRDGIAVVDPDGTVAFANRQYATCVGVADESLLGSHWSDAFPAPEAERLNAEAFRAAAEGWRWTGACTVRRGDEPAPTRISVVGLEDGGFAIVLDPSIDEESSGD